MDGAFLHNRKVMVKKKQCCRAKPRIFGKWLLGWVSWRFFASNLTPRVGSDKGTGSPRFGSLVGWRWFSGFHFEVIFGFQLFFFNEGNSISCCVKIPEFWEHLAVWGLSISILGEVLISLLFGAVIHMGSCLMTGWSEMGSGNKEPNRIHQNYRVI